MDRHQITHLAKALLDGDLPLGSFVDQVSQPAHSAFGEVTLDLDRHRRCGFPEVVYGEGKRVETIAEIFQRLVDAEHAVLATRISEDKATALLERFPTGKYNPQGRTFRIPATAPSASADSATMGKVALITAGSSDLPVAEEARETMDWMGLDVTVIHDVGVAGPHRLPAHLEKLRDLDAVVVVAGMEGALPSVVGGYVDCPVIAVPTSVGYGAALNGIAALLGMLNSCASNVTVVNIDAGFKGGYVAGMIARRKNRG